MSLALWSPPYYALRIYGDDGDEIGRPQSVADYVKQVMEAVHESMRCLAGDGSLFVNIGDRYVNRAIVRSSAHQSGMHPNRKYASSWVAARKAGRVLTSQIAGIPEQSLSLAPERVAVACADAGYIVKGNYVWAKTFTTPDPKAADRCELRHEQILHLSRVPRVITAPPFERIGSVWSIAPSTGRNGHPAPWPEELVRTIVSRWSRPGDHVLDAFAGSGTTGEVCVALGRVPVLFDLYAP